MLVVIGPNALLHEKKAEVWRAEVTSSLAQTKKVPEVAYTSSYCSNKAPYLLVTIIP
jgi:hypothetical protein